MKKILLVEDEKDVAEIMRNLLKEKGYYVILAFNGREALAFLKEEIFDLAIIDLILPDMRGYDLCAIIRRNKRLRNLPILISTGLVTESNQAVSKELGITEFLEKPYGKEDLIFAIERCLNYKQKNEKEFN